MLKIIISKKSAKFMKKQPPKQQKQIVLSILDIRKKSYPHDSKKLKNHDLYRTDCGEFRIIYEILEKILYIIIVGKRNDGDVYKKLTRKFKAQ